MSKKAIVGFLLILVLILTGLYDGVKINDIVVENKFMSVLASVALGSLFIIFIGFIFGFLKDCLLAFLVETTNMLSGKKSKD